MDIIANIKKYKQSFIMLSKNPENMFSNYLENNKLNEIEFLYQIGLNKTLVNEHNFEEIQNMIRIHLPKEKYPIISFPATGESLDKDNLSLYNPESNNDIVIGEKFIRFDSDYLDENDLSRINHTYYILDNNVIKKITLELNFSILENTNKMEFFNIVAAQIEYDKNGTIISDNNYTIKTKSALYQSVFKNIYRSLLHGSIVPGLAKVLELIKDDKMSKDDIEIDLNISDLLKK